MNGLRRLGQLVDTWAGPGARAKTRDVARAARGADAQDDAIGAALQTAWPEAVGEEVARRSRPTKFHRGVLTVMTASSTWSDQLTHLAPGILEALRRAVPQANVRRLRFVVAAGRSKLLLEGRAQGPGMETGADPPAVVLPQPEPSATQATSPHLGGVDPVQTVAHLRALQAALDAERDRAGWVVCVSCGRRFAPLSRRNLRCAPCAAARNARGLARIERLLVEAPWLDETAVLSQVPHATPRAYERARQRLLARWQQEIAAATRRVRRGATTAADRVIAWSYVMLATGLPERALGRAVVIEVLGPEWAAVLFDMATGGVQEARVARREKR